MTDPNESLTDPLSGRSGVTPPQMQPPNQQVPPEESTGKQFEIQQGTEATSAEEAPSPMEIAAQGQAAQEITPEMLQANMNNLIQNAQGLHAQLTEERFNELTPGQKALLDAKLGQFNEGVKGMSQQVDVPYTEPEPKTPEGGLKTYLNWLTQGQDQIANSAKALQEKQGAGQISVADMMRVQAKMMQAQRAINFASAVAGKGADFVKTMMQTQL